MQSLQELTETDDPAWPLVQEWLASATNVVEVLPSELSAGEQALLALQITLRSPMGAVAYYTGGLLIDYGWLRILGAGSPKLLRSLPDWNVEKLQGALLVADDVLGGLFAINGGAFSGQPSHVHYFSPQTLAWKSLGAGYTDFLRWTLTGNLELFYSSLRWPDWEKEVAGISGEQALSVYPFLWTTGPSISKRSRRDIPVAKLYALNQDFCQQRQK
ncbi:DUF2625 domain-containing protein [Armatimonas sp.]|uniref:DUF2625 domain-containing protein n=1 Tax=Armatimonas sp. TaxID=1872638 RepID=UPI00286B359D|nr:DUF2625 domain-containing protein [Armatimonas sp.]